MSAETGRSIPSLRAPAAVCESVSDAILLSAHGTVRDVSELEGFLTRIGRGRPPTPALLAEITRRYERIGRSPLLDNTRALGAALEAKLGVPVVVGMRLSEPTLAHALAEARGRGATRVVSLPLAPQSVHVYHAATRAALPEGMTLVEVPSWGTEPGLLDAFSARIDEALRATTRDATLVLTAHSLPLAVLHAGDPYERDVRAMCASLVERRGEARPTHVAFQSQGAEGAWLGPRLDETLRAIAADGAHHVVVAAIGFLSEHVETLYDLDVEAAALAQSLGLDLVRARSLDASADLVDVLADLARRALGRSS